MHVKPPPACGTLVEQAAEAAEDLKGRAEDPDLVEAQRKVGYSRVRIHCKTS